MLLTIELSEKLLHWYDHNQRILPWRSSSVGLSNPYHVWLSEIMLQQTTVITVKPYFEKFITRWSTIHDLAEADLDDVLHSWQGLGYYARARHLHQCAQTIVKDYDGNFPQEEKILKKLPGIGDYTAAAIVSIAFNKSATVIDGNVSRIISRLYAIDTPYPNSKLEIKGYADKLTPNNRSGDYAQGLMDLGATICTPTSPKCLLCPLTEDCKAFKTDTPEIYPKRLPKQPKPHRYGIVFWIVRELDGAVLLRKRPSKGLLAGMMEIPSSEWINEEKTLEEVKSQSPLNCMFLDTKQRVHHTFTHFFLDLVVYKGIYAKDTPIPPHCCWVLKKDFGLYPLPTVMKKVIQVIQP